MQWKKWGSDVGYLERALSVNCVRALGGLRSWLGPGTHTVHTGPPQLDPHRLLLSSTPEPTQIYQGCWILLLHTHRVLPFSVHLLQKATPAYLKQ